jgi:hypothetical protein
MSFIPRVNEITNLPRSIFIFLREISAFDFQLCRFGVFRVSFLCVCGLCVSFLLSIFSSAVLVYLAYLAVSQSLAPGPTPGNIAKRLECGVSRRFWKIGVNSCNSCKTGLLSVESAL